MSVFLPPSPTTGKSIGIIGRGIAGLSLAFLLRKKGWPMVLWGESQGPSVASRAAQGLSNSKGLWVADQPLFRLKLKGHGALPAWLRKVEQASGRLIPRSHAIFEPYQDEAEFRRIMDRVYHGHLRGLFRVTNVRWQEVLDEFPHLPLSAEAFLGAHRYGSDLWFDVDVTLEALEAAIRAEGHRFCEGRVQQIVRAPDGRHRIVFPAGHVDVDEVVLAAGDGSPALLKALGIETNGFRSLLGATADAELSGEQGPPLALLFGEKSLVVQGGRVRLGAVSAAEDESDGESWARGEAAGKLGDIWCGLARGPSHAMRLPLVVRTGRRLRTRRRLPVADRVYLPHWERPLYVMTAFYKNGLQLAPLAAERVSDLLEGREGDARWNAMRWPFHRGT